MSQKSYDNTPSVYLIPTPIGNLDDLTGRSIKVLEMVDVIFSEDTRVTGDLLSKLGIKKKLVNSNDHNEDEKKKVAIKYLEDGKNIGIVTDRGTPIISDPGYKIVEECIKKGYNVIPLPGANALIPALISSGINPSPFMFYGFLMNAIFSLLSSFVENGSEPSASFYKAGFFGDSQRRRVVRFGHVFYGFAFFDEEVSERGDA